MMHKFIRQRIPVLIFIEILLFSVITPFLDAQQNNEASELFARRIVWKGGENAFRYAVEVDRLENGSYQDHLREFTTVLYIDISLPLGSYRFRIIPHDILDRPSEGTQWIHFEVREPPKPKATDPPKASANANAAGPAASGGESEGAASSNKDIQVISADDHSADNRDQVIGNREEEKAKGQGSGNAPDERAARFNTLGVSVGSSFIDPAIIAALHGSYAPLPVENIFFELGCDFGFISIYDDVKSFYCLYPFANVGYFYPFTKNIGFFASAGGGYLIGEYEFEQGKADFGVFGVNFTAGVNLWNMIDVSYTYRTNFNRASNKVAVGYVWRIGNSTAVSTPKLTTTSTREIMDIDASQQTTTPIAASDTLVSNKRYELVNKLLSWTGAKLEAERRGGYLAVITSQQEQNTIEDLIKKKGNVHAYWIGGYCEKDRIWKWINNEPMNYTNWGPGEPNNYQRRQDKMRIMRDPYVSTTGHSVRFGQWDDDANNSNSGYIIEYD